MNKNAFRLPEQDFRSARDYVSRKLANEPYWLDNLEAENTWRHAQRDLVTLSQWCNAWLTVEQWRAMKAAIRAARKRRRDQSGQRHPPVHVTLSRRAWLILSNLARRDGVTLSQWLIQHHEKAWLQLPEPDTFSQHPHNRYP
jgi:hypothetical protein